MKMRWVHCEGGKNLPEPYKSKVCIFRRGPRTDLEVCVLVEDLFEPEGKLFWVIKGETERKEVFPFAWLEIDTDISISFLENLAILGYIDYRP